ncbi:MAG: APH(3') family aminoglycoside O-phosphotransferase [Candidatus Fimenecus sp.]
MTQYPALPKSIADKIKGKYWTADTVGESDSNVYLLKNAVLKIEKTGENANREAEALQWLCGKLPVPQVLNFEQENGFNYLLMSKIHGVPVCDMCAGDVETTVATLADGLKQLWRVDISACPLDSRLNKRLPQAKYNIENGLVDTEDFEPDTLGKNGFADLDALYDFLKTHQPAEDLVFTHGDYCLPNLFAENGKIVGFIDLGKAGVADRWQDIALCVRSLQYNLCDLCGNPHDVFLKAKNKLYSLLNIQEDTEKLRYYILLDELF